MLKPTTIGIATIISLASVPAQASFCGEIEKLVRLSKDHFSSILGPRDTETRRVAYKSRYIMPEADECTIVEIPKRQQRPLIRSLRCYWEYGSDSNSSLEAYKNLSTSIRQCGFFTSVGEEDQDGEDYMLSAYHKEGSQVTIVKTVRAAYDDGTYSIRSEVVSVHAR